MLSRRLTSKELKPTDVCRAPGARAASRVLQTLDLSGWNMRGYMSKKGEANPVESTRVIRKVTRADVQAAVLCAQGQVFVLFQERGRAG